MYLEEGFSPELIARQTGWPCRGKPLLPPPPHVRDMVWTMLSGVVQSGSACVVTRGDPYLHPEWEDSVAAIRRLPLPARSTTVTEPRVAEPESKDEQVQVPEELVMVGPWGLEPQTSTVSR